MKVLLIVVPVLASILAIVLVIGLLLPKQHVASRSSHFSTSPSLIWAIVDGPPDWRSDIKSYEILPPVDGRRTWKEVDAHGDSIMYEVVESTSERKLVTRIADETLPFGGTWTYEFAPDAGGVTLTITERGEVYNPIFRFVSRFVFGHTAQLDKYLTSLKTRLEAVNGTGN